MVTTIIGVDCATRDKDTGLALGYLEGEKPCIKVVKLGDNKSPVETVKEWITCDGPILIALDAPLGWPAVLSKALGSHQAGAPLNVVDPNKMFRRYTDEIVRLKIGKQSLDVGADRIARTAHAALTLLQKLRDITHREITLAWEPFTDSCTRAIEVYPAATLAVYGIKVPGYKHKEGQIARRELIGQLKNYIDFSVNLDMSLLERSDDALDAVVCVLAGADFLRGEVIQPDDRKLAEREGWIWVRRPQGRDIGSSENLASAL